MSVSLHYLMFTLQAMIATNDSYTENSGVLHRLCKRDLAKSVQELLVRFAIQESNSRRKISHRRYESHVLAMPFQASSI